MKQQLTRMLCCCAAALSVSACGHAQNYASDRPAYVIYDSKGRQTTYRRMLDAAADSDVCLFGELHNDPISHWMELNLVEDLHRLKPGRLTVGAEMWERDNQATLDEFLRDSLIDLDTYNENSRMWPNYATDYQPVLAYAAAEGIPFVATNIPRRYARMVAQQGIGILDSLDAGARAYLPEGPVAVPYDEGIYALLGESFKQMSGMPMKKSDIRHYVEAQAIKDATMAYWIDRNLTPGSTFFHFHGELHSALRSGIAHYLRQYAPGKRIVTISVQEASDPVNYKPRMERADFLIIVPETMTKTYVD